MRQWRVGTFSMGLLLLFGGIGLLYAQFNGLTVANIAFKWWPLIFVALGIEVLLQYYFKKTDDNKIKYDIFSIFIILLIVAAGLGIQAASEVGLVKYAQEMINSQNYSLQSPATQIAVNNNIQKVVIEANADVYPLLKIRTAPANSILYYSAVRLRAQSQEEAQHYLQQNSQLISNQAGDTLYINLNLSPNHNRFNECIYTMVLPEKLAVEIDRRNTSLQINADKINSDWIIQGSGSTEINLPAQSDLMVTALISDVSALKGNLSWTRPGGDPLLKQQKNTANVNQSRTESELAVSDQVEQNSDNGNETNTIQAQAKLGNGSHKFIIINNEDNENITVNQLP